jgi:DNA-binding NtrC family response regulator
MSRGSGVRRAEAAIIGDSYKPLVRTTKACAEQRRSMLIVGERGVGKELFADLYAAAAKREIVKVNCADFGGDLLASELFGHEKGAFTGSVRRREGILPTAEGKVVLLDEIGDASERMQAEILRVLRTGEYRRVGADQPSRLSDVLFVAATNKPEELRADLSDRFDVTLAIHRPRDWDIAKLLQHYISRHEGLKYVDSGTLAYLYFYPWPGNMAEIENVILEAMVNRQAIHRGRKVALMTLHLPRKVWWTDVEFKELEDYYVSLKKVPVNQIRDYITEKFPRTDSYLGRNAVGGGVQKSKTEEEPQPEDTTTGLSKMVGTLFELPLAMALEEFEKTYYLENAVGFFVKTQRALALKIKMRPSKLNRRLRELGIRDEVKRRLRQ